ncbi:MAG TPA: histidine kinase [Chitinophagales bacterium]|nr:histidine kinase [Chitinophagales bacterium]
MKKNKLRLILIQVSGAVLFLLLPILISPDLTNPVLFKVTPFQIDFISYALLLIFFYLNFFLFVPQFYFRKKYKAFVPLIVLSYAAVAYLPILITRNTFMLYGKYFPYYLGQSLFKFLSIFIFSLLIKVNNKWKRAEEERKAAELSFLKAQVNPHFLFNTLNGIYSQAISEKAIQTSAGIIKLSDMMRYISNASGQKFVALEKELNYIQNYIELQKNRFGDTVKISCAVSGETEGKQIAPLILISFVENAFKHGVNPEENSELSVLVSVLENSLEMEVVNNKVTVVHQEDLTSGIGIQNTSNRLKLIYPDKHKLVIENKLKEFCVRLKILLQ